MSNLPAEVESQIVSRRLLTRGEPLLVAVSGGLDSMVLLHLLHQLSRNHQWLLRVAHFNHQLRGRSSRLDARLVAETSARLGIPCSSQAASVKRYAQQSKLSLEMAARKLRHEFLARVAREHRISKIALAHHADDQVELFFLRLLRGAGTDGLTGMKWLSPSPADPDLLLLRPLLGSSKMDLAVFAASSKIRFREDATNASPDFLRNRIRHELLPLLQRRYQPAVLTTTLRLMDILAAESEMLSGTVQAWLRRKDRPGFLGLPLALQRRILQAELIRLGLLVDFELVEWLRQNPAKTISVQPHLRLLMGFDGKLHLLSPAQETFSSSDELALDLQAGQGTATFDDLAIKWKVTPAPKGKKSALKKQARTELFDADKVGPFVLLRHWRPGDRFHPIGMSGTVKLQDWFSNLKIPRPQRHQIILATTKSGEIFWIENQRISENAKVTPQTSRILRWVWTRTAPPAL